MAKLQCLTEGGRNSVSRCVAAVSTDKGPRGNELHLAGSPSRLASPWTRTWFSIRASLTKIPRLGPLAGDLVAERCVDEPLRRTLSPPLRADFPFCSSADARSGSDIPGSNAKKRLTHGDLLQDAEGRRIFQERYDTRAQLAWTSRLGRGFYNRVPIHSKQPRRRTPAQLASRARPNLRALGDPRSPVKGGKTSRLRRVGRAAAQRIRGRSGPCAIDRSRIRRLAAGQRPGEFGNALTFP